MGSIYRSELMSLCQLFLQTDSAYDCVAELGELGMVQFRDLNIELNSYQKKFVNEVRRCDEMERKLRFVEEEIKKDEIIVADVDDHIAAPKPRMMVQLETHISELEEELLSINTNVKTLTRNHVQLLEMKAVLEKVKRLLDENLRRDASQSITEAYKGEAGPLLIGVNHEHEKDNRMDTELRFLTGVLPRANVMAFERLLWRMCHGKVYTKTIDVVENMDNFSDSFQDKTVFIVFFSGEQLMHKVKKICSGFHATIYNCPESAGERASLMEQIRRQVEDMKIVINKTMDYRHKIVVAAAANLKKWTIQLLKLKSVFHTLNMFSVDVTQKCLIAECWIPSDDIDRVQAALARGTEVSGSNVHAVLNQMQTNRNPPTFFRTNKFTKGFQNIIDAYGIAAYREVNPAPWSIISFPFLFAVMFGDSGHGVLMLLAAGLFVIFEKKLISMKITEEIFNTFFGGRYVVLLMSMFSIYTGFIYNDIYSKSVDIFGSSWKNPYNTSLLEQIEQSAMNRSEKDPDLTFNPVESFLHSRGPYYFGLDPVWNLSKNKLNFLNPMKMKTSVLLGIGQMSFGLILSLCNYIHRRSIVDTLFVFIPQCLFLGCIFVYLCIQIVIKWIFIYTEPKFIFGLLYPGSYCAPSLLIGLINMFMMTSRDPGYVKVDSVNSTANVTIDGKLYKYEMYDQCYQQQWYPHQQTVELILIIIAVISIPVMLFVKPFYLRWRHNRGLPVNDGHAVEGEGSEEADHEFNFGDIMVYQAIHTIEFALGCISHTASYLRLWALSLAHAQLSEVLWSMLFSMALKMGGWGGSAGIFFLFGVFANLSVFILIMMEGLSAFLHTLRLHWVEFNSKFFGGTGYAFDPFNFEKLIRISEGFDE